jgi:coenzyme PQQ synthesis protein D (PqqD)
MTRLRREAATAGRPPTENDRQLSTDNRQPTMHRLSPDVVFRDLEGEAVILDLTSGRYFGLNAVGTRIWMLLEAGTPIEQIVRTVAEEYAADAAQIDRDVKALVEDLLSRRLIIRADEPRGGPA